MMPRSEDYSLPSLLCISIAQWLSNSCISGLLILGVFFCDLSHTVISPFFSDSHAACRIVLCPFGHACLPHCSKVFLGSGFNKMLFVGASLGLGSWTRPAFLFLVACLIPQKYLPYQVHPVTSSRVDTRRLAEGDAIWQSEIIVPKHLWIQCNAFYVWHLLRTRTPGFAICAITNRAGKGWRKDGERRALSPRRIFVGWQFAWEAEGERFDLTSALNWDWG